MSNTEAFTRYIAKNPRALPTFIALAAQARESGESLGPRKILEAMRKQLNVGADNSLASDFAREAMRRDDRLDGYFSLKDSAVAVAEPEPEQAPAPAKKAKRTAAIAEPVAEPDQSEGALTPDEPVDVATLPQETPEPEAPEELVSDDTPAPTEPEAPEELVSDTTPAPTEPDAPEELVSDATPAPKGKAKKFAEDGPSAIGNKVAKRLNARDEDAKPTKGGKGATPLSLATFEKDLKSSAKADKAAKPKAIAADGDKAERSSTKGACGNCGHPKVVARERCNACYTCLKRKGHERPLTLEERRVSRAEQAEGENTPA